MSYNCSFFWNFVFVLQFQDQKSWHDYEAISVFISKKEMIDQLKWQGFEGWRIFFKAGKFMRIGQRDVHVYQNGYVMYSTPF